MLAMLVGNTGPETAKLRAMIARGGYECPRAACLAVDEARSVIVRRDPAPDVVFVVADTAPACSLELVRQLRACSTAKLVALSAGFGREQALDLIRAGANDCLDLQDRPEQALEQLLKRLQAERASRNGKGRVIAIASASGGCGCSTVAVNLAAAIAQEHGRCGLLDLNLRGGDLSTLLGLKSRHSLADLCGHPNLDQAMFEQSLTAHETGIRLLASPTMLENVGHFDVNTVEQVVDMAAAAFPFVVADLEDVFHREQFRVVSNCDILLLALRLDFVSLVRTGRTLMYLQREGVEMSKIQLVANRYNASIDVPLRKAQEALGRPLTQAIPDNPKAMGAATNMGSPVVCDAPASNVAKALRDLARTVMVG